MARTVGALVAVWCLVSCGPAAAALVRFDGDPSTRWAGGTFSTGLSGDYPDGFYNGDLAQTAAYDGYGQNGESITFNRPVTVFSLEIGECGPCTDTNPTAYQLTLLDGGGDVLGTQTVTPAPGLQSLSFDTPKVETMTFGFTGGADAYGDGRQVAFYELANVSYQAVPEPASWMMMLLGIFATGVAMRARRLDEAVSL